LALLPTGGLAQSAVVNPAAVNAPPALGTNYTIVSRGPNSRVWQRVVPVATNQQGRVAYRTNAYTELKTAIYHLVGANLVESSDEITITPDGGEVTNCAHSVVFSTDINSSNAVQLTTPTRQIPPPAATYSSRN
jgi:hypothetical protein